MRCKHADVMECAEEMFTVYEVRRGVEYGLPGSKMPPVHITACAKFMRNEPRFCFGRIKFKGQETPSTWVVLGLLVEAGGRILIQAAGTRHSV